MYDCMFALLAAILGGADWLDILRPIAAVQERFLISFISHPTNWKVSLRQKCLSSWPPPCMQGFKSMASPLLVAVGCLFAWAFQNPLLCTYLGSSSWRVYIREVLGRCWRPRKFLRCMVVATLVALVHWWFQEGSKIDCQCYARGKPNFVWLRWIHY